MPRLLGACVQADGKAVRRDSSSCSCFAMGVSFFMCAFASAGSKPSSVFKKLRSSASAASNFSLASLAFVSSESPAFCAASAASNFASASCTASRAAARSVCFPLTPSALPSTTDLASAIFASKSSLLAVEAATWEFEPSTASWSLAWMPLKTFSIHETTVVWSLCRSFAGVATHPGRPASSIARQLRGRPSACLKASNTPTIFLSILGFFASGVGAFAPRFLLLAGAMA
mmetsp:Transcript_84276/g.247210  ORF Transcript_84276/g.247210 Transcript_84276/m.247210 type:complete len:230 (+) Transcript_84276:326-1015(+)